MAFVTGLLLIDAPASALNNLGNIPGERFDNSVGVKVIRTREGFYPYVSAQAFRYWLRTTLEKADIGWVSAPIYREDKIAYTDANPIQWWDDDLFGYMRAPSKKESARAKREAETRLNETETTDTVTRAAPFRVSTLVSIAPVTPTSDFGVMSRHEGDPVPHEHQFYRATLKGLFSLDLSACGTFWYRQKTGFRNLDDVRIKKAQEAGLIHLMDEKAYRLPMEQRVQRIAALFEGMSILDGGAKQTLHYTDVAPPLVILCVTRGGNHIFGYVIGASNKGLPELKLEALKEAITVFQDDILSDIYVGWARGYLDEERAKLEEFAKTPGGMRIKMSHPRQAFRALINALKIPENSCWME
ncbi:type I-B CRISPR-associated protein Cas7/Cst2/DevR [Desulfofundulus sp.]|uniref:type I-B CRISPR-associated protein Cas7/Cst2/DevR n=1 Tax=Desulfofundulus sp. TaxID=2282750 RepID=UPI003C786BF0